MAKYSVDDLDKDELFAFTDTNDERLDALFDKHIVKYRTKTIRSGNVLECEVYPIWDTRASVSRARRFRETREAQKKLNNKNAIKNLIRLINTNFTDNDIWGTFTYETKKLPASVELAQKEMVKFIRRLKYYATTHNFPALKYAYVTEFEDDEEKGKKRVHHHIVINFPDRDVAEKLWRNGARTQTRRLQADDSGYEGMVRYILKDPKGLKRYVTSKNLEKPITTIADYKFTKRKVFKIINGDVSAYNVFEDMFNDKYKMIDWYHKTSEYCSGAYIYAKMCRRKIKGGYNNGYGLAKARKHTNSTRCRR